MTVSVTDREVSRYTWLALVWAWLAVVLPLPLVPSVVALTYCQEAQDHITQYPDRLKGRELTQLARATARFMLWVWAVVMLTALTIAVTVWAIG